MGGEKKSGCSSWGKEVKARGGEKELPKNKEKWTRGSFATE